MAKVSPIRTNENEYSVPVVLSYQSFVTVFAKTATDAKMKVLGVKPKKLRKQAEAPKIKAGRPTVVASKAVTATTKKRDKSAHA